MRRKQFTTLGVALVLAACLVGIAAIPAGAEQRVLLATLADGSQVVVRIDAPLSTPISELPISGSLPQTVTGIEELPAGSSGPPGARSVTAPSVQETVPAPATTTTTTPSTTTTDPEQPTAEDPTEQPTEDQKPERRSSTNKQTSERETSDKKDKTDGSKQGGVKAPSKSDPGVSIVGLGAARPGVPNFLIDRFRIPPFLLSIYQAAGIEYGVRWEILAAINEIETDYGRNLSVSSAGAQGWMQFMPESWKTYGVDANNDGVKDPSNPADAIFAAARYLKAAGYGPSTAQQRRAIFAYNHADWYVDSVLLRARLVAGMPADLVGSLTGLTQGRFPVAARARYVGAVQSADLSKKVKQGDNAANLVESSATRDGVEIFARTGAAVVAAQDGVVKKIGESDSLGRYVVLEDGYGNRYTYGNLGEVATSYPTPKEQKVSEAKVKRELEAASKADESGAKDPAPDAPATSGSQKDTKKPSSTPSSSDQSSTSAKTDSQGAYNGVGISKQRAFANPSRPAAWKAGGSEQATEQGSPLPKNVSLKQFFVRPYGINRDDVVLKPLKPGARVIAGTILGRIGQPAGESSDPHIMFRIRPAGKDTPLIDPKPILDGWKLLESTALYRAKGDNPFVTDFSQEGDKRPTLGQILLMSKEELERRVLADPDIDIYECGRRDIQAGIIDRRVLATLEYLVSNGFKLGVSTLKCGHSYLTAAGTVSHHSSGNAVDIATFNGTPVLGHQGEGSITDRVARKVLELQGTMQPDQLITLVNYKGVDWAWAQADHADHMHIGFKPYFEQSKKEAEAQSVLKPGQWKDLIDQISSIDNPKVNLKPSRFSIRDNSHDESKPSDKR